MCVRSYLGVSKVSCLWCHLIIVNHVQNGSKLNCHCDSQADRHIRGSYHYKIYHSRAVTFGKVNLYRVTALSVHTGTDNAVHSDHKKCILKSKKSV